MPDRLISIGTEAFHSCWELTGDLTLPEGLTEIGDFAFRSTKLTSVLLPTTVTRIGNYAFDDCENLTQVNIPEGVTDIGAYAFYDTAITSVTIPSSVLKMGAYAFGNTPLENVKLEARLERIETGTFEYCSEL